MLSFPSTLNKGGSHLITPQQSNSLKDVLNNSLRSAFNSAVSKATSGQGYDTDGIRYNEDRDTSSLIDDLDFSSHQTIRYESNMLAPPANKSKKENKQAVIWTPTHMNNEIFQVVNNYRCFLSDMLIETGNDGEVKGSNGKMYKTYNFKGDLTPSLFNPYHGLPVYGIMENVPLMDGTFLSKHDKKEIANLDDCSIRELVNLSSVRKSILGNARYKYADFMYCKDLGKISNNHMITLRKFAIPVGDNIFRSTVTTTAAEGKQDPMSTIGDVGRMITWFDTDDNKLSDIMSYEYEASWKKLDAKIQQLDSQEDDEGRGIAGKIINNLSPGYNLGTANGINSGGLLGQLMNSMGIGANTHEYQHNDVALGRNYDNNKVYSPKDTIQDTHIYEGKLTFKHEFTLNFSYKLRAYDNINPKSAFLDLLGNILTVTYRKGTFWGGRSEVLGAKPNKAGWQKYNNILKGLSDAGGDLWKNIFHLEGANTDSLLSSLSQFNGALLDIVKSAGLDIGSMANNALQSAKDFLSGNMTASEVGDKIKNGAQKAAKGVQKLNLGQAMMGSINNKLGRPALYAFDSLLTGAKVGLWHVTIGNPKNPIATFGNLILTNAKITHSGPLGFDDFPTELHVSVSLKHAMSRDATEISKMYTKGQNGIYLSLCSPSNTIEFSDGEKAGTKVKNPPNPPSESEVKGITKNQDSEKNKQKNADNEVKDISKADENKINNMGLSFNKDGTVDKNKMLDIIPNANNASFDSPSTTQYTRFAWSGCDIEEFITSKDEMR